MVATLFHDDMALGIAFFQSALTKIIDRILEIKQLIAFFQNDQ